MTTICRYDYYQITLQINLSQDDSCLFNKYGLSIFSIKKVNSKACNSCNNDYLVTNTSDPQIVNLEADIPNALILSVDIDRCDCTKASFTIFVKLPCVRFYALSQTELLTLQVSHVTIINYLDPSTRVPTTQPPLDPPPCLANETSAYAEAYENLLSAKDGDIFNVYTYAIFMKNLCALTKALEVLRFELVNDDGNLSDTDPVVKAIDTMLGNLCVIVNETLLNNEPNNGIFRDGKFSIFSGASGRDKEIMTFYVKPLDPSIVSTGVFDKCYSYEITRVPERKFDPIHCEGQDKYAICSNGKLIPIAPPCDRFCVETPVSLVSDTLHITFALTKDLKCLLADFSFPGTVSNAVLGKLSTIVKIVSNCPQKFSFPAKMTFDKINCTVCLEIRTCAIHDYLQTSDHLYNSEFGRFGCASLCKDTKCSGEINLASLFKSDNFSFFDFLTMSRKLDVVGVHKCTEKTFFSFQVCTVPYKPVCVNICGCKLMTIPDLGDLCAVTDLNSYKVQADCDYTYEFSSGCSPITSTTNIYP